MAGEIWQRGAAEIARAVRAKELSCREVVEAHLARIDAVNPALNAVTEVLAEGALARAAALDRALARGDDPGPLAGVPMTVKENVDLAGSATTQGVPAMAAAVPQQDAPHLEHLLGAGAIPLARTNLPDFGLRWHTASALRGATRNPWDAGRTTGGSSGGDAAALASGMTPLGNGNDYGGSLRVPSQFCGTAALRPSLGRVPQHHSLAPEEAGPTLQLFAVQGPMARRVADLRVAFAAMCADSPRDPWWTPAPLHGPVPERPLRVAVVVEPPGAGDVHPDVADGVRRAADALADAGYAVEEAAPPDLPGAAALWRRLVLADIRAQQLEPLRPIVSADALRFLENVLEREPVLDLPGYLRALGDRQHVAREWRRFHARHPLLLGPVCTQPAFPVGRDVESVDATEAVVRSMALVVAVNLLGLPAAAVPVGVAGGLPQGVQLVADRFREDLCLDAAEAIELRLGTLVPIDPRPG